MEKEKVEGGPHSCGLLVVVAWWWWWDSSSTMTTMTGGNDDDVVDVQLEGSAAAPAAERARPTRYIDPAALQAGRQRVAGEEEEALGERREQWEWWRGRQRSPGSLTNRPIFSKPH